MTEVYNNLNEKEKEDLKADHEKAIEQYQKELKKWQGKYNVSDEELEKKPRKSKEKSVGKKTKGRPKKEESDDEDDKGKKGKSKDTKKDKSAEKKENKKKGKKWGRGLILDGD